MNIKSLLLGSAAALVAVSGARAADAVVMVEPEPAEYVRICDTYGTGYFYIPGTETCLKVGGYVRMRIQAQDDARNNDLDLGNLNGTIAPNELRGVGDDDYNVATRVRARLDFDAREETELGMLRAFARVQATNSSLTDTASSGQTLASSYIMDAAYIQLGGLTAGKLDSLWAERDGLFTDNDWSVGDFNNNRLSYTFAVAGFTAAISAEDDGSGDFVPDFVAQLAYEGGWGEAYISGVYDEQASTRFFGTTAAGLPITGFVNPGFSTNGFFFAQGSLNNTLAFNDPNDGFTTFALQNVATGNVNDDDGAFALKGGVTLKDLIATGSQLKVEGSYAFDPTVYTTNDYISGQYNTSTFGNDIVVAGVPYSGFNGGGFNLSTEWQVGAAYQQQFGKLFAAVSGIYGETFDLTAVTAVSPTGVITTRNFGNAEFYGAAANVGYELTSNFSILGEVSYREVDLPSGFRDFDQTGGFLELKRTF